MKRMSYCVLTNINLYAVLFVVRKNVGCLNVFCGRIYEIGAASFVSAATETQTHTKFSQDTTSFLFAFLFYLFIYFFIFLIYVFSLRFLSLCSNVRSVQIFMSTSESGSLNTVIISDTRSLSVFRYQWGDLCWSVPSGTVIIRTTLVKKTFINLRLKPEIKGFVIFQNILVLINTSVKNSNFVLWFILSASMGFQQTR